MKPKDDIHKLIKKLQIKASAELDRRVHNDISKALAESEQAVTGPIILRFIMKGGAMKLAIAAAIIIAFGVGFSVGQRSRTTQLATYSLDVASYTTAVSTHPTAPKTEDSFWRQKAVAAMQPRPYAQTRFDKTSLLVGNKQYLKEKYYD
jgi:hypothetical protein